MKKGNLRTERERHRREYYRLFILKAAEEIFVKKGYSAATMDDIAEAAQFSKASIYRYFNSKGELFFGILVNSFEEFNQKLKKIQEEKKSAMEKVRKLIKFIFRYYEKKENVSRVFFMDKYFMKKFHIFMLEKQSLASDQEKRFINEIRGMRNEITDRICKIFSEGMKAGEFRKLDVLDVAYVFEAVLCGFYFMKLWYKKKYSLEEETDLIHGLFLHSLRKEEKD